MQAWRYLLFPFSVLYGTVMAIRNLFFDWGLFASYPIPGKSIVIGNLSMGGTGKSPHALYVLNLLKDRTSVATLSRGYGRKTKGLLEVTPTSLSEEVGDEPLMFKKRVGDSACVVVSENRQEGVRYIQSKHPEALIVLDDAFQHRKVTAGFSVLLTDFNRPFFSDFVVPMGTLREWRGGKNRADCVVVTKCPERISDDQKQSIVKRIGMSGKPVYFSRIEYDELISFGKSVQSIKEVLLVAGIAKPQPLIEYLKRFYKVEVLHFPDHHNFTMADISEIHRKIGTFASENAAIITTEKDFVRLDSLLSDEDKQQFPWYYQPIRVKIDEEEQFKDLINRYVDTI